MMIRQGNPIVAVLPTGIEPDPVTGSRHPDAQEILERLRKIPLAILVQIAVLLVLDDSVGPAFRFLGDRDVIATGKANDYFISTRLICRHYLF